MSAAHNFIGFGPDTLVLIAATFLLAGVVKGVVGLGLPTVSLGVLTAATDLTTAMALMIVPSLLTNVIQASVGGHARVVLARIWPFLLMAAATVWVGSLALTRIDLNLLSGLLGVVLIAYGFVGLVGLRIVVPARREPWVGVVLGAVNGVLTGMTGSFAVPGVMFLQAIGLSRDALVQAMGMLFTVSTVALAVALRSSNLIAGDLGTLSALALVPAIVGMVAGNVIRKRLPEAGFQRLFYLAILILGGWILLRAIDW